MCRFCNKPGHKDFDGTISGLETSRDKALADFTFEATKSAGLRKDNLLLANRNIQLISDLADCRAGGQPTLPLPNVTREISRDEVYALIDQISRQTLRYLDDNVYWAVSKEDFELYALWVGAYKMPFIPEKEDCDDYTLKLRAEKVGVPGWRGMPVFDVQYRHPILGPHSEALPILIEGDQFVLYIIEGQQAPENGRLITLFREALPYFTNIKPTLIKQ